MNYKVVFQRAGQKNLEAQLATMEQCIDSASKVAELMVNTYRMGGKVLIFGNGGSAGDAQHIVGELMNQYTIKTRPPLAAIALTANSSVVTAIANDNGFLDIFSQQVEALVRPDDLVIGLSTSGQSGNVLRGLGMAKSMMGVNTVAFVGSNTTNAENIGVDVIVSIPSESTPRIQEMHMFLAHTICEIVEIELFGAK